MSTTYNWNSFQERLERKVSEVKRFSNMAYDVLQELKEEVPSDYGVPEFYGEHEANKRVDEILTIFLDINTSISDRGKNVLKVFSMFMDERGTYTKIEEFISEFKIYIESLKAKKVKYQEYYTFLADLTTKLDKDSFSEIFQDLDPVFAVLEDLDSEILEISSIANVAPSFVSQKETEIDYEAVDEYINVNAGDIDTGITLDVSDFEWDISTGVLSVFAGISVDSGAIEVATTTLVYSDPAKRLIEEETLDELFNAIQEDSYGDGELNSLYDYLRKAQV